MNTKEMPSRLADITKAQINDQYSLGYARWLSCLGETAMPSSASELFMLRYPHDIGTSLLKQKAAVAPGTTTDPAWAKPLVEIKPFKDAFLAIARSASLLGRIPNLRNIPFNTKVPTQTAGASFAWVQQGHAKVMVKLSFSDGVTLLPTKCAGIVPFTRELVKSMVPGADATLRDTLVAELTSFTDRSFLDPASTAIPDVRPGSITAGTTPIASTSNYATDLQTLLAAFFTANPSAQAPVLIVSAAHAAAIASLNGGGGVGIQTIVSDAALTNTILMDARGVFVADAGVEITISEEGTMQVVDNPASPAGPTTTWTSFWQDNLVGYRIERFVNWQAVPNAVKYLAGA